MREVAASVQEWIDAGRTVVLVRSIGTRGFGGHPQMELLAVSELGRTAGAVLAGTIDHQVLAAADEILAGPIDGGLRLVVGEVDTESAQGAGMACGGVAQVLLQRAEGIPRQFWSALVDQVPVALATVVEGPRADPRALVVSADSTVWGSLGDSATDQLAATTGAGLLAGGMAAVRRVDSEIGVVLVEALVPDPRLVVVGDGSLCEALLAQSALLGWEARPVADVASAEAALAWAARSAAVVVLSHAPELDAPALAAAVGHRAFYLGALGSRRTQAARALRLRSLGVAEEEIERIRGPVGLDLGGQSPALIALAVCAEILAVRTGREAIPLRDRRGAIR